MLQCGEVALETDQLGVGHVLSKLLDVSYRCCLWCCQYDCYVDRLASAVVVQYLAVAAPTVPFALVQKLFEFDGCKKTLSTSFVCGAGVVG